jgi:uncharacterized protein (DUF983 family)
MTTGHGATLWPYVGRALMRRCPRCGERHVWRGWFTLRERCPLCGLELDRGESDHFYGAYLLNFVVAELIPATGFVVAILVTWPTPPWTAIMWGAMIVAAVAPFVTYPYAKTLWLALDLYFRRSTA